MATNKALKNMVASSILSLALLMVALLIWLFMKDGGILLQDILFCVGALPVALFSISVFGRFFGRGNHSYQLSRSVSDRSPNQRAQQDARGLKSNFKSGMNWVTAGVVILLICYAI